MRFLVPVVTVITLSLVCCRGKQKVSDHLHSSNSNTIKQIDTSQATQLSQENITGIPKFDTLSGAHSCFPDNGKLRRKRRQVLKQFEQDFAAMGAQYDTLVDINYDRFKDYILGYYGGSGTGFKYRVAVYLYSKARNNYVFNDQLSAIVNPSFFIPEHTITSFYIGLGAGGGYRLEWINNKWKKTKTFEVDNAGDSTIWDITYPMTNKREKIIHPFQVIPPDSVLETNASNRW